MKHIVTVILSEAAFNEILSALGESLAGKELMVDFLVNRFGLDSEQVKTAIEKYNSLALAAVEFNKV